MSTIAEHLLTRITEVRPSTTHLGWTEEQKLEIVTYYIPLTKEMWFNLVVTYINAAVSSDLHINTNRYETLAETLAAWNRQIWKNNNFYFAADF